MVTRYIRTMSTKSTRNTRLQSQWSGALVAGFSTLRIDPSRDLRTLRLEMSRRNEERKNLLKSLFQGPTNH